MIAKFLLPALAIVGLSFGGYTVWKFRQTPPAAVPDKEPPKRTDPWDKVIAGSGIVEAKKENIPIGANVPGVVLELFVKVGMHVEPGDLLFRTDDRNFKGELAVREANLLSAKASLDRLKAAPQTQDIPTATAAVDEARAKFYDTEIVNKRTSDLYNRGVSTASEYDRDRYAHQAAKATLVRAEADLNRIRTTWAKDIAVAEAAVLQAQSQLDSTKIDVERCNVRALVAGDVLQVNIRPGQFAGPVWKEALIVLGDVNALNLRVDIDEREAPYFNDKLNAYATLRGLPDKRFELKKIVKTEPYVIPKKNLTGENSELVDTRVLQVVYALPDDRVLRLYVGQQMDVYMEGTRDPAGYSATRAALNSPNTSGEVPRLEAVR